MLPIDELINDVANWFCSMPLRRSPQRVAQSWHMLCMVTKTGILIGGWFMLFATKTNVLVDIAAVGNYAPGMSADVFLCATLVRAEKGTCARFRVCP